MILRLKLEAVSEYKLECDLKLSWILSAWQCLSLPEPSLCFSFVPLSLPYWNPVICPEMAQSCACTKLCLHLQEVQPVWVQVLSIALRGTGKSRGNAVGLALDFLLFAMGMAGLCL